MVPEIKGDVIYITTEERAKNWEWEKDSEKIDKRVQFLSREDLMSISKRENWNIPPKCFENDVLVRYPYQSNKFIFLKDIEGFRNDKFMKICEIAQILGASAYKVNAETIKIERRKRDTSVAGVYKTIKAKLSIKRDKELKESYNFKRMDLLKGDNVITDNSYEEAVQRAKEYNLYEDTCVQDLLHKRDPKNGNISYVSNLQCVLTKEENSALDIACSLDVLPKAFSLDSNVKELVENKISISLKMTVVFPGSETSDQMFEEIKNQIKGNI